jgi:hypothetical protein
MSLPPGSCWQPIFVVQIVIGQQGPNAWQAPQFQEQFIDLLPLFFPLDLLLLLLPFQFSLNG